MLSVFSLIYDPSDFITYNCVILASLLLVFAVLVMTANLNHYFRKNGHIPQRWYTTYKLGCKMIGKEVPVRKRPEETGQVMKKQTQVVQVGGRCGLPLLSKLNKVTQLIFPAGQWVWKAEEE